MLPILNYFDPLGVKIMATKRAAIKDLPYLKNTKIVQAYEKHIILARLLTKSRFNAL